jgi:hypothetical protein
LENQKAWKYALVGDKCEKLGHQIKNRTDLQFFLGLYIKAKNFFSFAF